MEGTEETSKTKGLVFWRSHTFIGSDERAAVGAEVLDILASIDAEGDAAAEPETNTEADDCDEPAHATSLVLDTSGDKSLASRAVAEDRALRGDERLDGGSDNRDCDGHSNWDGSDTSDRDRLWWRSTTSDWDGLRSGGDCRISGVDGIGSRSSTSISGVCLVASSRVVICHF